MNTIGELTKKIGKLVDTPAVQETPKAAAPAMGVKALALGTTPPGYFSFACTDTNLRQLRWRRSARIVYSAGLRENYG